MMCTCKYRAPRLNDASPEEHDAVNFANKQQPPPIKSTSPALWNLVIKDMGDRDHFGLSKYKTHLQANNGRDFLADAYQEALDLTVYLRGAIYERDNK